jgi:hypothetical protein
MTPPRREAALKSVAVTGTDNVGQGFRPNLTTIHRTHQPPTSQRDGGQNRKARQRPDPGRSTKAPPPRMPPTQTIPLPAQPRPPASTHTRAHRPFDGPIRFATCSHEGSLLRMSCQRKILIFGGTLTFHTSLKLVCSSYALSPAGAPMFYQASANKD